MDVTWYTSIAGIVAATMLGVQALKRFVGNRRFFSSLPTWIYAVVLSLVLTIGSKYFGVLQDPGTWLELTMRAVMQAGMAAGFFTWLNQPTDAIGDSTTAINARTGL